jgi:hypothetical protein
MPRPISPRIKREVDEILEKSKTKRRGPPGYADDPHQQARAASNAAHQAGTPETHRRAARAFRTSARKHRREGNQDLSNYQERNAEMHDREAQEAQFDWPFVANAVRKAVSRTFRVLGNPTTGYRVFIADAYRSLTPGERAAIDAHTLPQFKQLLIALNRRRLINLDRADIQEIWIADGRTARDRAASRKLAKESETTSLGAEFHFIEV